MRARFLGFWFALVLGCSSAAAPAVTPVHASRDVPSARSTDQDEEKYHFDPEGLLPAGLCGFDGYLRHACDDRNARFAAVMKDGGRDPKRSGSLAERALLGD